MKATAQFRPNLNLNLEFETMNKTSAGVPDVDRCVRCGHSGSVFDGICLKYISPMMNCGCKCVFPSVSEVEDKNSGEGCKDLATQTTRTLRAAQGDGVDGVTGRELDAAVAERVMGWLWMSRVNDRGAWLFPADSEDVDTGATGVFGEPVIRRCHIVGPFRSYDGVGRKNQSSHIPNYSTSIADAMEVENRIVELNLTRAYCDELYNIVAVDKSSEQLGAFRFDLIHATPEQRCRAALAAVVLNEEK